MPTARRSADEVLPRGLTFFLAHGRTPDINEDGIPHGFGNGVFEAFQLWGRVAHLQAADVRAGVLTVLDELRQLWEHHEPEIRAAARGEKPWVATLLAEYRNPEKPRRSQRR